MAKPKRPTPEEDAEINRGIAQDPDTWVPTDEEYLLAKRGAENPFVAALLERQAATRIVVDPAVAKRLGAQGARLEQQVNAILRRAVGLD